MNHHQWLHQHVPHTVAYTNNNSIIYSMSLPQFGMKDSCTYCTTQLYKFSSKNSSQCISAHR